MCVAVPGKILSIDADGMADVDFDGTGRRISVAFLDEPRLGEYVIVHAGFALHKIDPGEAEATLNLLRQYVNSLDDAGKD